MGLQLLVAGGGIGGLAAALACTRAGATVEVHEQAPAFSEVGAGIQLGPNVTRILEEWGLGPRLREGMAAAPRRVRVYGADDGAELARLEFDEAFRSRYGAPYLTIHRGDLHRLLLQAAQQAGVRTHTGSRLAAPVEHRDRVEVEGGGQADALVAADGIWSAMRDAVVRPSPPSPTGHVAYRSVAPQSFLPAACRTDAVNVWLGSRLHVLAYPVRGGDWLNVVALVEGSPAGDARDWDQAAVAVELRRALGSPCAALQKVVDAMPDWRLWALHDRPPLRGAQEMARGRIALLGDAAHPMLPYLAQGAGMAIEDAQALSAALKGATPAGVPQALQRYSERRWQRCARVQATARRNAVIFHASGPLRWSRDLAMRTLGPRLIDQPWLYR